MYAMLRLSLTALLLALALTAFSQASRITGAALDFQNGSYEDALTQARQGLANGASLKDKDIAKANSIIMRSLVKIYEGANKEKDSTARASKLAKHGNVAQDAYKAFEQLKAKDPKGSFDSEVQPYLPMLGQILVIEGQKSLTANPPRFAEGLGMLDNAENLLTQTQQATYTIHLLKGLAYVNQRTKADSLKALESFEKCVKSYDETIARLEKEKGTSETKAKQYDVYKKDKSVGNAYAALVTLYARVKSDVNLASKTAEKGKAAYPDNEEIVAAELNMYLDPALLNEALSKFKQQLEKTPDNVQIILVYANLLEKKANALAKAGKPRAEVDATFDEAVAVYKKILAKDPKHRDANFNIGAIYVNRAVDVTKSINDLPSNASDDQYEALKKQKDMALKLALPFLETTGEVEQYKVETTLNALVGVCADLGEADKMNQYKAKPDQLQGK